LNQEPETKDNVNIVKQEHADNQSEKSSIQGVTTTYNITEEGLVKSESNREISEVHIDEQDAVKSCSRENLHNKNACEIRVEKASEAKQSTYVEIQESETQGNYYVENFLNRKTLKNLNRIKSMHIFMSRKENKPKTLDEIKIL